MVLRARTKIIQSPNSSTQYITIPADVVKDSQYPFLADEVVELRIVLGSHKIEVSKTSGKEGVNE